MSTESNRAPVCDIDFYGAVTVADPVPTYAAMLELGPIVWLEKNNLHAICGHSEVVAALRNHTQFSSGQGVSLDDAVNKMLIGSTLHSDPPQHDETRKITFTPLAPGNVQKVRERIQQEADKLVKRLLSKGRFDAASELAPHLPLSVVRDLVGLGDYGKDHMLDWGAATFELMGDAKERSAAAADKLKKLRSFLEDSSTLDNLSRDGWARRATRLGIEAGMEPGRAAELMRDYIAPSLDTTISAIGYGIRLFADHPDQWLKLRDDRNLMRGAIEEIVRLNTPIRAFSRYLTEDVTVAGIRLEKASRVLVVYGAANRDPSRFSNPNDFDITRKTTGHVGFGQGVHTCLGMNLARLEMTCLFNTLADSVQRFELTGPVVPGCNSTIHSLASVPVRCVLEP
ncbi:MAG: cytochrome P450 [Granulosicoccus sp.]|nr:cytochrome P450 [Granulosicoccus sp.]